MKSNTTIILDGVKAIGWANVSVIAILAVSSLCLATMPVIERLANEELPQIKAALTVFASAIYGLGFMSGTQRAWAVSDSLRRDQLETMISLKQSLKLSSDTMEELTSTLKTANDAIRYWKAKANTNTYIDETDLDEN